LILERVTGQKTEKHGTQRCREGQDKEEYRRQETEDRRTAKAGRMEWWKNAGRRQNTPVE
jgi:hypothetical protein